MAIWTPNMQTSMEIDSEMVDLHDTEILAFKDGPIAWVRKQEGLSRNIHQFTKDLTEQFAKIGFGVEVQVWDTNVPGAYIFKVIIQKRLDSTFDPDQQVHEVVNNILELPDQQEGFINTGKSMQEFERERRERRHGPHSHN